MAERSADLDLLIAGGGPVGAALALALRDSGLKVALCEARPADTPVSDRRTLALSHGSRLILERLGAWAPLQATPITAIHVSQRHAFGRALLGAQEAGVPALGYVLRYADLQRALAARLAASGVDCRYGAQVTHVDLRQDAAHITYQQNGASHIAASKLLAVADGGRSLHGMLGVVPRQHDYHQHAVVAEVATELPHRNTAYERFTEQGPAALLPCDDGLALVWTADPARAQELCALDDATFLARLHEHFGDRLGRFTQAGPRSSFPLLLKYADPLPTPRSVLIGNAAQMLHPVAGQGFNLGLRDAWELAQAILSMPAEEMGSTAMLAAYRKARRFDRGSGIRFTDALVRLFSSDRSPLRALLGLGLEAFDAAPAARRFLARRMMFGAAG
ncbi:MAG: FAD-dependent monooxygenase [Pseudomonadota bacterium]